MERRRVDTHTNTLPSVRPSVQSFGTLANLIANHNNNNTFNNGLAFNRSGPYIVGYIIAAASVAIHCESEYCYVANLHVGNERKSIKSNATDY